MILLSFDVGIRNLAYCQIDTETLDILDWNVIDCTNPKQDTILSLIESLEEVNNLLHSDIILIEKQPSFNPQMRVISTAIYVYFIMRIAYEKVNKLKIMYYSAKNKLKLCSNTLAFQEINEMTENGELRGKKGKRKCYTFNKKAAIEQTLVLLENKKKKNSIYQNYINYFEKSKKKDDLADCYLQAIAYCS